MPTLRLPLRDGDIVRIRDRDYRDLVVEPAGDPYGDDVALLVSTTGSKICHVYRASGKARYGGKEWDVVKTVKAALTLPLTKGQRVICADGTTRIIAKVSGDTAFYDGGCRTHAPTGDCEQPGGGGCAHIYSAVADALDWSPIDWNQPLVADWKGRTIKVTKVRKVNVSGYDYSVDFDESEGVTSAGAVRGFCYNANGCHRDIPDVMPVIRNANPTAADSGMRLEFPLMIGQRVQLRSGVRGVISREFGARDRKTVSITFDDKGSRYTVYAHNGMGWADGSKQSSYDVVFNIGVPDGDKPAVEPIRTRVRKPKPTLDQNFKELAMVLVEAKDKVPAKEAGAKIERAQWLLKQILQGLKTDTNIDGTIAQIYEDARAEAQKVIDSLVSATEADIDRRQRDITDAEQKLEAEKNAWEEIMRIDREILEEDFEGRVKREVDARVDQMFGRKATITRKRALAVHDG